MTQKLNRRTLLTLGAATLLALGGCSSSGEDAKVEQKAGQTDAVYRGNGPIKITVTTGMIADIVRNVGGERVQVTALMGPGVDPHLYKASQSDIAKLSDADIIFYNGLHLEGKMGEILERVGESKPVVPVSEKIDQKLLRTPPEFAGNPDPHVWFDVSLWMKATETVRESLVHFDAANKELYAKNAGVYLPQLQKLHNYAKAQIATVPKARRVLVTAHDAFGYFGRAYDIEVVGLQGISTAGEYGLNDVQRLVDSISKRRIKAVFVESSIPRRSIEAVVQGCKAKGHNVNIGGTLYSDAMGGAGTPEANYIGMVKHNVDTIVKALK
ncbi:MAG TPA: zinc ABC transporter substrate-binding protein [Abditibacteriaceae bacterium]